MTPSHRRLPARAPRANAAGHAMVESLLIVSFAAVTLAAIPAIADYGTKRMQAVAGAKLVAWQRTVWMPEDHGIPTTEATGAGGAIKKTDAEVTRDLRRHIFRDRSAPGISIHAADIAEFEPMLPAIDQRTTAVTASSTAAPLPSLLNASDKAFDGIRVAQAAMGKNAITFAASKFTFVSSGYMRHEVKVSQTNTKFTLVPALDMSEQVTMLTEAWNAGGTNREETKIQGLVPLKLADAAFYQQLRSGFHQAAYSISQVFPSFANSNLTFGLTPGDAGEKSPLDRFERVPQGAAAGGEPASGADAVGGNPKDRFRYYRAFPPTPVVNVLP
ncbi:hypothetical protein NU688_20915 [Variovorax sp. ZS18.2.2]|uniref:hypothetical protein n=1 Tax=Variovorax sp. ZS18.2.2 TaxID=2971255 RepID=UPI002151455E|nr:hypothetical protein [Variovorax sp. ZS18.2.2]MCR6478631.1 hypothetical protein [Variovorax sp. ZS18.2.2]